MKRQAGFTLIELLATSAATMVVIAAASGFLLKGLTWYDELNGKIEMNRHARETYRVLAYGGRSSALGKDKTKNVYSIRGFKKKPGGGQRKDAALEYKSNKLTLTPDNFSTITITCKGDGIPVPDCKTAGSTKKAEGWIGDNIKLDDGPKSINGYTVNVTIPITNPFQAQRSTSPAQFSDEYRTIFTTNRDEDDPS